MSYSFKEISTDIDGLSSIEVLMKACFGEAGSHLSASYLDWMYNSNPAGKVVGFNAYLGDELAAHYAIIPMFFVENGEKKKGLLSLNTATHPNHREKGLFVQLAQKTYGLAKEMEFDFVTGVANQNSTHGFVKKLGFQFVSQLDVKVGFGKMSFEVTENCLRVNKAPEFYDWRLKKPTSEYSIDNKSGLIFSPTSYPFIKAIMGETKKRDIMNHECRRFWKPNVWIGLNPSKRCEGGIYFNLPEKLKKSPLNFIFKDLKSNRTISKDRLVVELLDFDAY